MRVRVREHYAIAFQCPTEYRNIYSKAIFKIYRIFAGRKLPRYMALITMHGRPIAQAAFALLLCAFVARWYANVVQLHTRLEVELDHGRGGARSRAGCLQSESSESKYSSTSITSSSGCLHNLILNLVYECPSPIPKIPRETARKGDSNGINKCPYTELGACLPLHVS